LEDLDDNSVLVIFELLERRIHDMPQHRKFQKVGGMTRGFNNLLLKVSGGLSSVEHKDEVRTEIDAKHKARATMRTQVLKLCETRGLKPHDRGFSPM
jgi:hypothetical protein